MTRPLIRVMKWRVRGVSKLTGKTYYRADSMGIWHLDNVSRVSERKGKIYQALPVTTERQLLLFIKNNFGNGEYTILAFVHRKPSTYILWKGQIDDDGWLFYNRDLDKDSKKDIAFWEKEMLESQSQEDLEFAKSEIKEIKSEARIDSRAKKYGLSPFLTPSGPRGQKIYWEDSLNQKVIEPESDSPEFILEIESDKKNKKKFDDMDLNDINNL